MSRRANLQLTLLYLKLPSKIVYPLDWMPQKNEIARQSSEEFLQILEGTLGVKRTEVRLAEEWTRTAPEDVRDIPISEYLKNVCAAITNLLLVSKTALTHLTLVWLLSLIL